MTTLYDEIRELQEEVQRLQCALHFWLPGVPATGPDAYVERIAHDAYLLIGWEPEGDVEKTAEELGWITLQVHPKGD